jgi:hypothetical protein
MDNLRAELAEILDEAEWEWLMPHVQRDVVVMVDPGLDLLDVGVAIASDNTTAVQHWIGERLLSKPSPEQIVEFAGNSRSGRLCQRDRRFKALIVQPYVLVQDLGQTE